MEITRQVGFLIAQPAGGIFVALFGGAAIMMVDGITFLISAITIFLIQWRQPLRVQEQAESIRHSVEIVFEQAKEGIRVIRRERLLQLSVFLGFALNLIVAPIQVLMPLFVRSVKHGLYAVNFGAGRWISLTASLSSPLPRLT